MEWPEKIQLRRRMDEIREKIEKKQKEIEELKDEQEKLIEKFLGVTDLTTWNWYFKQVEVDRMKIDRENVYDILKEYSHFLYKIRGNKITTVNRKKTHIWEFLEWAKIIPD